MHVEIITYIIGPLAGVSNLTTGELIPGLSILLSWVAPFTLDITNVEPDITYCVDARVINLRGTSHTIRIICGITATAYNMTFNEGEVTPCDTVGVTVTPVNGQLNNGTRRDIDSIHLFEGIHYNYDYINAMYMYICVQVLAIFLQMMLKFLPV